MQNIASDEHGDEEGDVGVADKVDDGVDRALRDEQREDGCENDEDDGEHDEQEGFQRGGLGGVGSEEVFVLHDLLHRVAGALLFFLRVDEVRIHPAHEEAGGQADDDAPDDEPADVRANLACDGQRARSRCDAAVGKHQAGKDGDDITLHALFADLLQGSHQRGRHDVGTAEVDGDGEDEADEVQRKIIVLLAEQPDHTFCQLLGRARVAKEVTEDAAEHDEEADARHHIAEAGGQLAQNIRSRHPDHEAEDDGGGKQTNRGGDFKLDERNEQEHEDDQKRDQWRHDHFPFCRRFCSVERRIYALWRSILPGAAPVNCLSL